MGACSSKSKGVAPGSSPTSASLAGGLTILTIGLDNSGKSTMLGALTTWMTPDGRLKTRENGPPASEVDPFVVPTVGFSSPVSCPLINGAKVTFYDIGGGARIRGVWPQYFADVHGIVYVVDSADRQRVEESAEEMKKALLHPRLVGKPLLM
jgi:GTPase SAR1 family protein